MQGDKALGPRRAAQVHASHLGDLTSSSSDSEHDVPAASTERPGDGASLLEHRTPHDSAESTESAALRSARAPPRRPNGRVPLLERARSGAQAVSAAGATATAELLSSVSGGSSGDDLDIAGGMSARAQEAPDARRATDAAVQSAQRSGMAGGVSLTDMLSPHAEHAQHAPGTVPGMAPHFLFRNAPRRQEEPPDERPADCRSGSDAGVTDARGKRRARDGGGAPAAGSVIVSDVDTAGSSSSEGSEGEHDDEGLWYDAPSSQQLAQCLHDVGTDEHFRFQPTRSADGVITPAQPAVRPPSCCLLPDNRQHGRPAPVLQCHGMPHGQTVGLSGIGDRVFMRRTVPPISCVYSSAAHGCPRIPSV